MPGTMSPASIQREPSLKVKSPLSAATNKGAAALIFPLPIITPSEHNAPGP